MRILVLSNVPPSTIGGAEVQAYQLSACWSSAGHFVTVAGYANREFSHDRLTVVRIPTWRFSRIARGLSYVSSVLWFLWVKRRDYDIVYCRFMKEQAIAACLAKILFRLPQPLVVCPAGTGPTGDVATLVASRLRHVWMALLNRQLTCINAMSPYIAAEVRSLGFTKPIMTSIPNGVAIPSVVTDSVEAQDVLHVVYVGRLAREKGVDVLINACKLISGRGYRFSLEIIGDGPLRKTLESLVVAENLKEQVKFSGEVPPDEVSGRLQCADLFVLPSISEGFPGSLLEACANGLPAIATWVSGSEDIVKPEFGWLVPPGDGDSLATALSVASGLDRKSLRAMGQRARESVRRNYDIECVARQYEDLFRELLVSVG